MESNRKLDPIVTELFLRRKKLNVLLVFISQSRCRGGSRVRLVRRKQVLYMKYKNMKKVTHGFLKKYKILQKLVYVMITENISSNLHHVVQSAVTNESNTVRNMTLH